MRIQKSSPPLHARGFSLVEIMVGAAIGLIAAIVIMKVFTEFEGQKRTTTSGSDAQTNGALALYTIERDVRMAGYGFNIPTALGCKVNNSYNGANQPPFILAPVTITNGTGGMPDTVNILASSKGSWSVPARITTDHPPTATNFFLNTTLGIAVNDLMIAFEPGKDCTLLQVTGIPNGNVQIHHQNTSPWDPPGGQNIFPQPDGYNAGATLFDMGTIVNHTYSLDANSNLVFTDFVSSTNTSNVQTMLPNIVNLQAQYGFDTRSGAQSDAEVDTWSDTMIDADGSGTAGDAGDIRRVYALRFAIVARSALLEKPDTAGNCHITTASPSWTGGTLDVSRNPDGSANGNWQCYRYRVFETVVPIRNSLWAQS